MTDEVVWLIYIGATIAILPAILFGLYAQLRVWFAFEKYSKIATRKGVSGAELAEEMLVNNGVNATVTATHGRLSDHYDPRTKTVALSNEVFHGNSLAAVGVAAHEVGHAVQDEESYGPLKLRQAVISTTKIINALLLPLIFVTLIIEVFFYYSESYYEIMLWVMLAFAVIYFISFIVNVITIPTEFNASNRAIAMLQAAGLSDDEIHGAKQVLKAAALTYVAAMVISLVELLRILMIVVNLARSK